MRLAFLLQPRADSAFVLCHTRAAETTGPRLWCTASGASVIFSLEDIQKKHPDGELWRLVLAILMRGRDLILEYRPWQENGEEGFSLEDVLTDTESEDQMLEKIALRQAISKLPQRERCVVELRYFHCLTQQRVAKIMNVSQVQVSRIEKKALALLREMLR